jgi:hypothetical protein
VPTNAQRLRACHVKTQPFSDRDARGRACVALFYRWLTRVAMQPLAVMQAEHGELDRPTVGASLRRSASTNSASRHALCSPRTAERFE